MDLLATKPLNTILHEAHETGESSLKRALGAANLVSLGIGAIIGTGIFVLTGVASAKYAGPAVVLSFMLAAFGCVFAGLCYAEFASMIPVAGSAYTYGYATLGEIFAWIIGWDLILEYAFGAATVASGWSGYVISLLGDFGIQLPPALAGEPGSDFVFYKNHWEVLGRIGPMLKSAGIDPATLPHKYGVFNLLAFLGICHHNDDFDYRHPGVRGFQQLHCGGEGNRSADFYRDWRPFPVPSSRHRRCQLASVHSAQHGKFWLLRLVGDFTGGAALYFSPTLALTRSPPRRRKPRTPRRTCPSEFWARWLSARFCTFLSRVS